MAVRFQLRRDTAANWTASNPTLALGEPGVETDTLKVKVGNGSTAWNSLAYSITKDFTDLTSKPTTVAGYGITDALTLTALSVTQNAASGTGALTYNNTTGVFEYTPPNFEGLNGNFTGSVFADDSTIMVDGVSATLNFVNNTTTDLTEGTNLYYTNTRADARIALQVGANLDLSSKTTSDLAEGTNEYYTSAKADARIAAASITDLSDADQTVQTTDDVTFNSVTSNVITSLIDSVDSSAITITPDVVMSAGLTVGNHILPSSSLNIDLGSDSFRFRDLYLSGNSAVIGDIALKRHVSGGLLVSDHSTGDPTNITTHNITANDISAAGNVTVGGYLAGPATFVIDPAAVGDDTGTVVIAGSLQVDGTTTTINSTTVNVDDLNIQLATGAINAAAANGAGITVDGASATLTYNGINDEWEFNKNVLTTHANGKFISNSSSSGDYVRLYAAAGTGKWDIYGNGANLRFSDNDSAGKVVFDTGIQIGNMASNSLIDNVVGGGPDYNLRVGINQDNADNTTDQIWTEYTTTTTTGNLAVKWRNANDTGTASTRLFVDGVNGRVGVGTPDPKVTFEAGYSRIYSSGAAVNPSSGKGLEIHYVTSGRTQGEGAYLIPYDRDGSAYKALTIDAQTIRLVGGNTLIADNLRDNTFVPSQRLHVYDPSTAYILAETGGTGTSAGHRATAGTNDWVWYATQGADKFRLYDYASSLVRLSVKNNGNVAIGVDDPEVKLEVNGGADGSVVFGGRSDGGNGNNRRFNLIAFADGGGAGYGGGLKIQTRDSVNVFHDRITVKSDGKVGINTDNPAYEFDHISDFSSGETKVYRRRYDEVVTAYNHGTGAGGTSTVTVTLSVNGLRGVVLTADFSGSRNNSGPDNYMTRICHALMSESTALRRSDRLTGLEFAVGATPVTVSSVAMSGSNIVVTYSIAPNGNAYDARMLFTAKGPGIIDVDVSVSIA